MSLERAYVNCMRCHGLYEEIEKRCNSKRYNSINESDRLASKKNELRVAILQSDPLYNARNEAMEALEDYEIGKAGLYECICCDYSEPKIADWVEEHKKKISCK